MYKKIGKEEGQRMNIDFGESQEVLKGKYMDVYVDVYAEEVMTNRFDKNVDLSTAYLGKIDIKREDICYRKSFKWRGMSDFIGYRCE